LGKSDLAVIKESVWKWAVGFVFVTYGWSTQFWKQSLLFTFYAGVPLAFAAIEKKKRIIFC